MKENILSKFKEQKSNIVILLKYFGYAVLFFLFSNTKIAGNIMPCFYGFYLTLLFLGENPFYLSLSFLVGYLCVSSSVSSIIFSLICCCVGSIASLYFKRKGKIMHTWLSCVVGVLLGIPHVYFSFGSLSSFYYSVVNIILNSIFILCCSNFFKILKFRKFNLNLNIDEIVCGCLILAFLFCGIQNLNIFIFDITKLIGIVLILLATNISKSVFSVAIGVVMGLGASLTAGDLSYISLFGLISVFAYIFKGYAKIYSVLMTLIVDLSFSLFFLSSTFNILSFTSTIISCVIYFVTPQKLLDNLKAQLFLNSENDSLKNILNQNKMQVSKRLLYASEIFYEMDKNFRCLVKGNLDVKNAKLMICNELLRSSCESCPQKAKCMKGFNSELKKIFEQLVNIGFEKGKVTLVDLPAYLTNRCGKLNQLVNTLNVLLSEYKKYNKMMGNLDASKVLIAEQLGGISQILANLSNETKQTVVMDYKTEKLIKETLIYNDIVPSEVVCFEKDEKTNVVSLIIRTIDYDNSKIVKILNKICKCKMQLDETLPGNDSNLTYLSYKTAPTYDIAVGIAQSSKGGEDICGDTHSASKLIGDKFMFALCDGMGHGKSANKASELSISLIENFYKAGFDNQTILTSVNKLLNLGREDIFSALDVSVVDLKNGEVDFIKQGATIGFIKKGEELNKIESNSLPLGILEEVKPKVTKTVLSTDDFVIMLSDGIVDAFGEEENLTRFLKNLPSSNPQELADKILNRAKRQQQNYPKDDMTVLVGKIFYNFA